MPTSNKKNFFFAAITSITLKGEWGGLEKLMFDWFERIDYSVNDVYRRYYWLESTFLQESFTSKNKCNNNRGSI